LHDETSEIFGKIKENMKTSFRFQALGYEYFKQAKKTKAAPTEGFVLWSAWNKKSHCRGI
jgi:hypothetical protein